jgi:hypothetical protein
MKPAARSSTARVRRCRAKQAGAGLTRVELQLDQPTLEALDRYVEWWGESRSETLRQLVVMALVLEGRMTHRTYSRLVDTLCRGRCR